MTDSLELWLLDDEFAITRLEPGEDWPSWAHGPSSLTAVVRTAEELSVVAPSSLVPDGLTTVGPWRAFQVQGPLDFGLTGIVAGLAGTLARAEISLFAVSTYDTDYVLVRADAVAAAMSALRAAGHSVADRAPD